MYCFFITYCNIISQRRANTFMWAIGFVQRTEVLLKCVCQSKAFLTLNPSVQSRIQVMQLTWNIICCAYLCRPSSDNIIAKIPGNVFFFNICLSVFNGEPIPYPKRECIADEDNKDDKNDGKDQVTFHMIVWDNLFLVLFLCRKMTSLKNHLGREWNSVLIITLQLTKQCIKDYSNTL